MDVQASFDHQIGLADIRRSMQTKFVRNRAWFDTKQIGANLAIRAFFAKRLHVNRLQVAGMAMTVSRSVGTGHALSAVAPPPGSPENKFL